MSCTLFFGIGVWPGFHVARLYGAKNEVWRNENRTMILFVSLNDYFIHSYGHFIHSDSKSLAVGSLYLIFV